MERGRPVGRAGCGDRRRLPAGLRRSQRDVALRSDDSRPERRPAERIGHGRPAARGRARRARGRRDPGGVRSGVGERARDSTAVRPGLVHDRGHLRLPRPTGRRRMGARHPERKPGGRRAAGARPGDAARGGRRPTRSDVPGRLRDHRPPGAAEWDRSRPGPTTRSATSSSSPVTSSYRRPDRRTAPTEG